MRVAIIGAGFSGLGLGIALKRAGIDSFTILEKAKNVGGTWRENTYPGAACDLMSFAYCFSFEQKTDWTRKWSPQPEILEYLEGCAEKYGLLPNIRFGCEVDGARFDAKAGCWRIRVSEGGATGEIEADVLVSGVGQLHRPLEPNLAGLECFEGEAFHSARWNASVDLSGKRVGVIGNGASAIQFVPEIAPKTRHLSVFQRTPNWHFPRGDRAYTAKEKRRFARIPLLARFYRWFIWARQELLFSVLAGKPRAVRGARKRALEHLHSQISDPELRKKLTPQYPIGGKRILIDDTYYPTLQRDNVSLVTEPIERVEANAVVTADGVRHPCDVLIFATGFDTTSFLAPMKIEGLAGRSLETEWRDGAEAYYGLSVAGFPNFFMMYGPNTNLGHNSIVFMLECQANYIVRCLKQMQRKDLLYLDVRPEAMAAYNWDLQTRLATTAWAATPSSWYKNSAGRITNNWHGTTTVYWWRTRRPDWDAYRQVRGDPGTSETPNKA
jgi:cation diffusion facilitator CzcD-associated flavoprotein CzcO